MSEDKLFSRESINDDDAVKWRNWRKMTERETINEGKL